MHPECGEAALIWVASMLLNPYCHCGGKQGARTPREEVPPPSHTCILSLLLLVCKQFFWWRCPFKILEESKIFHQFKPPPLTTSTFNSSMTLPHTLFSCMFLPCMICPCTILPTVCLLHPRMLVPWCVWLFHRREDTLPQKVSLCLPWISWLSNHLFQVFPWLSTSELHQLMDELGIGPDQTWQSVKHKRTSPTHGWVRCLP